MTREWMRTQWAPAHFVVDGRPLCGTDMPVDASPASPHAARCGTCEVAAARLAAPPVRRVHVRIARPIPPVPPAGPVFAGVDPLVATLQRYERGKL